MKDILQKIKQRQEGAVAVEGLIMFTFLIFMLVFLMSFGLLMYQRWAVSFTANDVATRIAQSYVYPNTDPVMGYINKGMKLSISPFRYTGDTLEQKNADKAETYALWSLDNSSLAYPMQEPVITVDTVYDDFARRHVVVDISAEYRIPFGGALAYFGLSDHYTFHAQGRAVCQDLSDYVINIQVLEALSGNTFGSKFLGAFNKIGDLVRKIRDTIQEG